MRAWLCLGLDFCAGTWACARIVSIRKRLHSTRLSGRLPWSFPVLLPLWNVHIYPDGFYDEFWESVLWIGIFLRRRIDEHPTTETALYHLSYIISFSLWSGREHTCDIFVQDIVLELGLRALACPSARLGPVVDG